MDGRCFIELSGLLSDILSKRRRGDKPGLMAVDRSRHTVSIPANARGY
ncbi:MAG: hypothetical protein ACP5G0_08090 [Desulfomonilia bacterium]